MHFSNEAADLDGLVQCDNFGSIIASESAKHRSATKARRLDGRHPLHRQSRTHSPRRTLYQVRFSKNAAPDSSRYHSLDTWSHLDC